MSFNVVGLYILFLGGALLIALSFSIEPILSCLHRRRRYNQYTYLEWVSNESLQLHRLAHEGAGWGTWSRATEDIPVTKKDEVLGRLDLTEPLHPRLRPVPSDSEYETDTEYISDYVPEPLATPGAPQTAQLMQSNIHGNTDTDTSYFIQHDRSEAQHTLMTQNQYARFSNDSGDFPILPAHWPQTRSLPGRREASSSTGP
jgi:hypothetical protein